MEEPKLFQYPEGPIPVAKRLKVGALGAMKDSIKTAFDCIMTEYGGCVMCTLARKTIRHQNCDISSILSDHYIPLPVFRALNAQLFPVCGFNLKILNGLPEHEPSKACTYAVITRLICCEIFMNGRISACIQDIDRGSLDTGDIQSFGKWLKIHPLGREVNNLTQVVYNWTTLGLFEDGIQDQTAVHLEWVSGLCTPHTRSWGCAASARFRGA
ncbi:hypothetical protein V1504DRAFT_463264 [Lipomyces starkeyi]